MIKTLLATLIIASVSVVSTHAKTVKLPSADSAVASITIPDSWEPETTDNGVYGNSPDKAVFFSIVAVDSEKGMNSEIEDTFAMLKEHKVELDKSSKKDNKFKVNGLDAEEMIFQGKDEDGPASISMSFITVKDKVLILTYWVSTEDEKKHQAEVGKILNSLKPTS